MRGSGCVWFIVLCEKRIVAYFFGTPVARFVIRNVFFILWFEKLEPLPTANSTTMASSWQLPKNHTHTHISTVKNTQRYTFICMYEYGYVCAGASIVCG